MPPFCSPSVALLSIGLSLRGVFTHVSGALVFTSSDLGFAAATQGMARVAGFSGSHGTNNQRQILADYHHQGIAQR